MIRYGGLHVYSDDVNTCATGEEAHAALWTEISRLAWCPVLVTPPAAGLPWPNMGRHRSQQAGAAAAEAGRVAALPPLAPPRMARPPSDLWLVSAGDDFEQISQHLINTKYEDEYLKRCQLFEYGSGNNSSCCKSGTCFTASGH